MQNLIFLFLLSFVSLASAGPKKLQDSIEGKWQGFCSPLATSSAGRMCSYTFLKAGTGTYQCEYYKDLRCANKDSKTTNAGFHFTANGTTEKVGKINIEFNDREDIRQEKSRVYITGEVMRVQVYEVLRMPDVKDEKLEAQGVVPFFEYTKAKP